MNTIIGQIIIANIMPLLIGLAVFILIFIIFREVMLWYWRINENTESLKRIADSLETIATAADFLATDTDRKSALSESKPKEGSNIENKSGETEFSKKKINTNN